MPEISPDGRVIKFKIFPHYLEDIKAGRKKADVRKLDAGWGAILRLKKYVQFYCPETGDGVEREIACIECISWVGAISKLFADVNFKCSTDEHLFLVSWE